jgi:hypothetical protein
VHQRGRSPDAEIVAGLHGETNRPGTRREGAMRLCVGLFMRECLPPQSEEHSMSSTISLTPVTGGGYGMSVAGSDLLRALPEPRSSWSSIGKSLLSAGSQVAGALLPGAQVFDQAELTNLLQTQMYIQTQMQVWSMQSNIAKSEHETAMAPVRNMRVG